MGQKKVPAASTRQVIHEKDVIRHRLIVIKNGVPTKSPWVMNHEVGFLNGIYFHVGGAGQATPEVFRVSPVASEVL